jgi:hypothetical protein
MCPVRNFEVIENQSSFAVGLKKKLRSPEGVNLVKMIGGIFVGTDNPK